MYVRSVCFAIDLAAGKLGVLVSNISHVNARMHAHTWHLTFDETILRRSREREREQEFIITFRTMEKLENSTIEFF